MKKLIIAMIAAILGLSSCSKEPESKESKLLGSWELKTVQMVGWTVDAKDMGMESTFTFKDGNLLDITSKGETESVNYAVNGNSMTIDGEVFEFNLNGDTLVLKGSGSFGTSEEGASKVDITLTFKKLTSQRYSIIGSWKLYSIEVDGCTMTAEMANMDLTYTFKAGNILDAILNGAASSSNYTIEGNKLFIDEENDEYEFEVNADTLILKYKDPNHGLLMTMIFKKL